MSLPDLTLGIEEEYQIVDPETRELTPHSAELIAAAHETLGDQIKPELMQSQVEVGTKVCHSIAEARTEIERLRRTVSSLAQADGLAMVAASTHPFSAWDTQVMSAGERYTSLADDLRDVVRRLVIFGMHVHVGVPDPEMRIDVLNQARYFVPHVLALSTSSPFWNRRDTGLKSYRSVIFENMPRSGLPPELESWSDYMGLVETLVATGCITEPTKIWWDIRPHPVYPTVEFRMSDICTRVDEAICIAALLQAVVAKLILLRQGNLSWRTYRHQLINENKWRAVRFGLDGKLIDFGARTEVPARHLVRELLDFVDDVVDELGSREEISYVETILRDGTSADRQLAVFAETGSLETVVDHLARETIDGLHE